MFDQPIVERKSTSPLATSLLVLSAVCLLAAIVFAGAQIKSLTIGSNSPVASAEAWKRANYDKVEREIRSIVGETQPEDE